MPFSWPGSPPPNELRPQPCSLRQVSLPIIPNQLGGFSSALTTDIKLHSENSIETCILSSVTQIASPGWMHETSARGWCTGMTQWDGMVREVGGGFRMGNTCKSMADSCQCMTKTTTIL